MTDAQLLLIASCDRNLLYVLILFTAPVTVIIAAGPALARVAHCNSTKLTNTSIRSLSTDNSQSPPQSMNCQLFAVSQYSRLSKVSYSLYLKYSIHNCAVYPKYVLQNSSGRRAWAAVRRVSRSYITYQSTYLYDNRPVQVRTSETLENVNLA